MVGMQMTVAQCGTGVGVIGEGACRFETACGGFAVGGGGSWAKGDSGGLIFNGLECFLRKVFFSIPLYIHESPQNKK
jgi:hypothetical protein